MEVGTPRDIRRVVQILPMRLSQVLMQTLGIKREEQVLLVTDTAMLGQASMLREALGELSAEVVEVRMSPRRMHGEEPPACVAAAMAAADVVVAATSRSLSHTSARRRACEAGARVASMPGITEEMLTSGGMLADYEEVRELAERVAEVLTGGRRMRIEAPGGTKFEADISGREGQADTGMIHRPGDFGNLPAGEGFIAPVEGRSRGVLAFDCSFSGVGRLEEPLVVEVEDGRLKEVPEELSGMLVSEASRMVAEVGIGTNPCAVLRGNVLEDEKVLGTVHVAFGDNHTFGGRIEAEVHLDGVISSPDVWVDGHRLMEGGRLCFP